MEDPHGWKTGFCVCSGNCWGDLFAVSRSMEPDFLSVVSIYPRIIYSVYYLYRLLLAIILLFKYSYLK